MANTLETKTPEQLAAALLSYNQYMCEIPERFPVHPDHLHGLSEEEFCAAFRALEQTVIEIYRYLYKEPQAVGLLAQKKKTGEWEVQTSQHISCVKKLLYVIGCCSESDASVLRISAEKLMNAYMTFYPNISVKLADDINEYDAEKRTKYFKSKHVDLVFECLGRFGFHFERTDDASDEICVTYPEHPTVVTALHAFASLRICRISFGFDFTKFNHRVLAHPNNAVIPLTDLYSYILLPEKHRDFLREFNDAMGALNASYGECASGWYHGTLPCQYIYDKKVRLLQNMETGLNVSVVVRFGQKTEKMSRFIDSLPPEYEEQKRIARCSGCKKGPCPHRTPVEARGKKYVICNISWWRFPTDPAAIPYIISAYKM